MAREWEAAQALDDEERVRLHRLKVQVAMKLQSCLENTMRIFIGDGNFVQAAEVLRDIETIWQVLGLEYVVASERQRREREGR
jgi:hypothetical protein